jgi:hypothetical protein
MVVAPQEDQYLTLSGWWLSLGIQAHQNPSLHLTLKTRPTAQGPNTVQRQEDLQSLRQ